MISTADKLGEGKWEGLVPSWPFSETGGRVRGTLSGKAPLSLAQSLPTSALSAWRGSEGGRVEGGRRTVD